MAHNLNSRLGHGMYHYPKKFNWTHQKGLYVSRLSQQVTGKTWIQYERQYMKPETTSLSLDDAIEACLTPIPVDNRDALEALHHQYQIFSTMTDLALKELSDDEFGTKVMKMVEQRIFLNAEDFNLAIGGCDDAQSYVDSSWAGLVKFYAFLGLVADIKTPCAFYTYFNGPFTLRVQI